MFSIVKIGLYGTVAALAILIISSVTSKRFDHYHQQLIFKPQVITMSERERQLECLTKNIYFEAAHEPFEGKVAVAQVTMNRVNDHQFPNDVCAVVYEKNVFMSRVVCQFSWFCEPNHKTKAINKEAYKESQAVAKKVLLENFRLPGLENALFYHADYVHRSKLGKMSLEKNVKIGRHIFYDQK